MEKTFEEHLKKYLTETEIEKLLTAQKNSSLKAILVDESKISLKEIEKIYPFLKKHPFVNNAYIYEKNQFEFGKSLLFELGAFYILEPCSLMVNYFLNPNKDDLVLDCCASPGGKTIHASFKMLNNGLIIANEMNISRCLTLSNNIEKYGRKNVVVTNNNLMDFPSYYENVFDKIILDAPCSGSAMFRKDKKMLDDWTYEKVLKTSMIQKELIMKAYSLLAKNGTLIYSTCSFSYEEDEEVIKFLLENSDAELIKIKENPYFYQSDLKGTIHLFPTLFDGEGHYIALIKKPSGEKKYLKKNKLKETKFFNLNGYIENNHNLLTFLESQNRFDGLKIIKKGLILGEKDKNNNFIPHHHLSRVSGLNLNYLNLTEDETKLYLKGNTLIKNYPDGYYFLKYLNIPFAIGKITKNTLKNHYPKGLRKNVI